MLVNKLIKYTKCISVEPILFSASLAIFLYAIIASQYAYFRIAKDHGIEINITSSDNACEVPSNETTNKTKLLEKVSAETSDWILYTNLAGFIPAFFSTLYLSSWGDHIGRRPPLLISLLGLLLLIVGHEIIFYYELSVSYILIPRILCGLCGDFSVVTASCFAYYADTSNKEDRTTKLALAEASIGLAGLLANLISGVWVQSQGYATPLWLPCACLVASLVYVWIGLKESVKTDGDVANQPMIRKLCSCQPFVYIWEMLRNPANHTFICLGLMFCYFLQMTCLSGIFDIIFVYEESVPICMSPNLIGYNAALQQACLIVSWLFVKFFSLKINDLLLLLMGLISNCSLYVIYALSSVSWLLFVGTSTGVLGSLPIVVLRSVMSRLTSPDQQGALFALQGCTYSVANIAGSAIFNGVYAATVHTYKGTAFFVGVGIQVAVLMLFSIFNIKAKEVVSSEEYDTLETDA